MRAPLHSPPPGRSLTTSSYAATTSQPQLEPLEPWLLQGFPCLTSAVYLAYHWHRYICRTTRAGSTEHSDRVLGCLWRQQPDDRPFRSDPATATCTLLSCIASELAERRPCSSLRNWKLKRDVQELGWPRKKSAHATYERPPQSQNPFSLAARYAAQQPSSVKNRLALHLCYLPRII